MGQKRCYFQKQSGEVTENKGKGYIDSQKQTGKQSGEVVENTWLWKKQTGNKPTDLVENKEQRKTEGLKPPLTAVSSVLVFEPRATWAVNWSAVLFFISFFGRAWRIHEA